jgi:hypothetical protein
MPTLPEIQDLNASAVDILNVIRNNASHDYQDYVPKATSEIASLRSIGNVLMSNNNYQNQFLTALINRIGRVLLTNKSYTNPLSMFKKGMLELGETVEEIFVNIAKPHQFNPDTAQDTAFKREIPDVRAAFHTMNFQKRYKTTISHEQLRQAFLSWQGITNLISKIIESLYTAAQYDEFLTMKYLIAKMIITGRVYAKDIPAVTETNMKSITSSIKGISNQLEFMSNAYNMTGVYNHTPKSEQYLLVNSLFDATMDDEVLASAFNMDKAQFMGNRVLVDSFGKLDTDRLKELFANDAFYTEFSSAELSALDAIPAILIDEGWFMIFDNLFDLVPLLNPEGLYWNYNHHTWKTFSVSPFANAVLFVSGLPSITSVEVNPSTATIKTGQKLNFDATVVTANFAPQTVKWSITGQTSEKTFIDIYGVLYIASDEEGTEITVTATSTFDVTKTATATVTIA